MQQNQRTITEKTYHKLTLKIGLTGFSYRVWDTLQKNIVAFQEIHFDRNDKTKKVEDWYEHAFFNSTDLRKSYDEVQVIHDNNLNTFVPNALFDEAYLGSYLQYNTKVFETDFFTHDSLEAYGMHNVYIPYVHLNNFLVDKFGQFDYQHAASILVRRLLDLSKKCHREKKCLYTLQQLILKLLCSKISMYCCTTRLTIKHPKIYCIMCCLQPNNCNSILNNFHSNF